MLNVRRQRGAAPASCARLQPRQFPADCGDAGADQVLITEDLEGEAHQDRRKGREPPAATRLPDGRGRHPVTIVPGDIAAHRTTAAEATTSAGRRRPMVMRSGTPGQGKLNITLLNGRLRAGNGAGGRHGASLLREKPEKREQYTKWRIYLGEFRSKCFRGLSGYANWQIRKSAMGLLNTTLARFGWHLSPANAIPNLQRQFTEERDNLRARIRGCQGCVEARVLPRRFRAFNVHKSARRGHVAWLIKWPRHRRFSG